MSDTAAPTPDGPDLFTKVFTYLSILGLILALATEIPGTIANTGKWRTLHEKGSNAAVKEYGQAVEVAGHARTELEKAKNAAEKFRGEADYAENEATRITNEARKARGQADAARRKAKADADEMTAKAQLTKQKALTELQKARIAEVQKRTEADSAETSLKTSRLALRASVYAGGLINCPGTTYIAKIDAIEQGRCRSTR